MTTDLRALLREAADMLARVKPIDLNVGDDPHGLAARCRALADAAPTVAELPRAVAIRGAENPPTERCPTCDRDGCQANAESTAHPMDCPCSSVNECPRCVAWIDCMRHRKDWRAIAYAMKARALAAEPAAAKWSRVEPLIERIRSRPTLSVEDIAALMDVYAAVTEDAP